MKSLPTLICLLLALSSAELAHGYPVDAYERTGIRRLHWQHARDFGGVKQGWRNSSGAKWSSDDIKLRMQEGLARRYELTEETPKDPVLQMNLEAILAKGNFGAYDIALLDITDPDHPRFAGVRETNKQTPGSIGKVLVAAALLGAIAEQYPAIADRERLLRETWIEVDNWAMKDHHVVLIYTPGQKHRHQFRKMRRGDRFTLWELLDHALSRSSSASASTVWREATLMRLLGKKYPPAQRNRSLWKRWSKAAFSKAAFQAVDTPLANAGITPTDFRLRRFFTGGANRYITKSSSRTTPLAMVQWMLRVEQGRMIDEFSSLELKRLLYVTIKRIRYAYAPELKKAAVYSKSGSLYSCRPERGFRCAKYQGNASNILNTLVLVEAPRKSGRPVAYIVGLMSNELKRNASADHSRLGGMIHEMMMETSP